jgi:hypothetical protein
MGRKIDNCLGGMSLTWVALNFGVLYRLGVNNRDDHEPCATLDGMYVAMLSKFM